MAAAGTAYPLSFDVDPPATQSRLTVFFRMLMVIPHMIALAVLGIVAGILVFVAWLAIVITAKCPAGILNFNAGFLRWSTRVNAYLYLLTGQYPPFATNDTADYPVRMQLNCQAEGRNRLTTFFRMIMIIPHVIVLYVIGIAASVVLLISWFAALFTGMVPVGMHNFLVGYQRWNFRMAGYYLLLVDDYPPFSMN